MKTSVLLSTAPSVGISNQLESLVRKWPQANINDANKYNINRKASLIIVVIVEIDPIELEPYVSQLKMTLLK